MNDLNAMAAAEANDCFDGIGSKLKKGAKKAKSYAKKAVSSPKAFVKTIGTIAVAPMVTTGTMQAKAATHLLAKTKLKPFKKLNTATNKLYKSSFVRDSRDITAVGTAAAAVVVGGIYAAPAIASAASGMSAAGAAEALATVASVVGGSKVAQQAAAEDPVLAQTMAMSAGEEDESDMMPADAPISSSSGEVTTASELAQVAAASKGAGAPVKSGALIKTLGPAALGFAVAGPVGAGVGLAAGMFFGRKKAPLGPVAGFGVLESDLITVGSGSLSAAQQRLLELGFNPGPIDGKLGAKTRAGIAAFEKSWGLPTDESWKDFSDSLSIAWAGRPEQAKPPEKPRVLPYSTQPGQLAKAKPPTQAQAATAAAMSTGKSSSGFKLPSFKDPKVIGIAAALGLGAVLLFMPKGK